MALLVVMRPSLRKGAHVALSSAAWQEIRVRFGRDDTSGWDPTAQSKQERSFLIRGKFAP
jgi:hypothetical protein